MYLVEPIKMIYLKVEWLHDLQAEPILMYSELSDERYELRKVEMFRNGELGYAYDEVSEGTTKLSETSLPSENEIGSDTQFKPKVITKAEFEKIWDKTVFKL